jgi:hypothetical protein
MPQPLWNFFAYVGIFATISFILTVIFALLLGLREYPGLRSEVQKMERASQNTARGLKVVK